MPSLIEAELHHSALLAEQERTQGLLMWDSMQNAANARTANDAIREEGARIRRDNDANFARANEELKKPQTVYVRKGW